MIRAGVEIHIDVTSRDAKGNLLIDRLAALDGDPKAQAELIRQTVGVRLAGCDIDATGVVVLSSVVPGVAGEE